MYFVFFVVRFLAAAHERDDFQAIAVAEHRFLVYRAGHDLEIQFDGDMRLGDAQFAQKRLNGAAAFDLARLSVENDVHAIASTRGRCRGRGSCGFIADKRGAEGLNVEPLEFTPLPFAGGLRA